MDNPEFPSGAVDRRASLVVLSLLAFGLVNVVRLLRWGVEPVLGLVILLPILLFTAFGWLAFRTDRVRERAG